jgi:hypothetical protein
LATVANERRPARRGSLNHLSTVAPTSQGIALLLDATAADTKNKKTIKDWLPVVVGVIALVYLWQHFSRSATAKSSGVGCAALRLEPVSGLDPRSEADRERLALRFESGGMVEYRSAEASRDPEAIERAIIDFETARTFLAEGARWCALTFRLARLYAWRGQSCLSNTVFLDELRQSPVRECAQLAHELIQSR